MRTLQRVGAGLFALTLFTGLAACGDDDDAEEGTESTDDGGEEAAGDNAAFCDAVVEFNATVFTIDVDEESSEEEIVAAGEELGPLFQTVADEAPDDLSATAEELNETVQALNEGEEEAFNADETFEKYTGLVSDAIEVCEFDTIDVTAVDYAYEGAPDTVDAGATVINLTNAAETEDHMAAILKKKDGVELSWEELLELPEEEAEASTQFLGEAFASAGESGSGLAQLEPGDYALLCFIPVGSPEVEDGPPHFTEGMIHEFTVE